MQRLRRLDGESISGDAAKQISEESDGFAIRYVEDATCHYLRWQAGLIESERRTYKGQGMMERFDATVNLYRLYGYGGTRDAAIEMAKKNLRGGRK